MDPIVMEFYKSWPENFKSVYASTPETEMQEIYLELHELKFDEDNVDTIYSGLLKCGDVETREWTSLMLAAARSDYVEFDALMAKGADPFLPRPSEFNTLDWTIKLGRRKDSHDDIIHKLIWMNINHVQKYYYVAAERARPNMPEAPEEEEEEPTVDLNSILAMADQPAAPAPVQMPPGRKTFAQIARGE